MLTFNFTSGGPGVGKVVELFQREGRMTIGSTFDGFWPMVISVIAGFFGLRRLLCGLQLALLGGE